MALVINATSSSFIDIALLQTSEENSRCSLLIVMILEISKVKYQLIVNGTWRTLLSNKHNYIPRYVKHPVSSYQWIFRVTLNDSIPFYSLNIQASSLFLYIIAFSLALQSNPSSQKVIKLAGNDPTYCYKTTVIFMISFVIFFSKFNIQLTCLQNCG